MTSAAHSAAHTSALGLQTFAVVVSCGVTPYLDRTLRAVAAQCQFKTQKQTWISILCTVSKKGTRLFL